MVTNITSFGTMFSGQAIATPGWGLGGVAMTCKSALFRWRGDDKVGYISLSLQ
jgi:hypothetical protein